MPHNKAIIEMDGQEIELQMQANEIAIHIACANLDFHRVQQYRIMNKKLMDTKKQFHAKHTEAFADRYGITITINVGQHR